MTYGWAQAAMLGAVGRAVVRLVLLTLMAAACSNPVDVAGSSTTRTVESTASLPPTAATQATTTSTANSTTNTVCDDACQRPGQGREIKLARGEYWAGLVPSAIVAQLLAELGFVAVSVTPVDQGPEDMAAAGQADVLTNTWFPSETFDYVNTRKAGSDPSTWPLVRFADPVASDAGLGGFLVTRSWAEANGIETMDQINATPELFAALDSDGDGRGDYYAPEYYRETYDTMWALGGWYNLERLALEPPERAEENSDTLEFDPTFDTIIEQMERGDPVVVLVSTPSVAVHKARIGDVAMWLSVEDSTVPLGVDVHGADVPSDPQRRADGTVGHTRLGDDVCLGPSTGCQLGTLGYDYEFTVNRTWAESAPAARMLLDEVTFTPAELSAMMADMGTDVSAEQADKVAAQWMDDNREKVDGWLHMARTGEPENFHDPDGPPPPGAVRIGRVDGDPALTITAEAIRLAVGFSGHPTARTSKFVYPTAEEGMAAVANGEIDIWASAIFDGDRPLLDSTMPDGSTTAASVVVFDEPVLPELPALRYEVPGEVRIVANQQWLLDNPELADTLGRVEVDATDIRYIKDDAALKRPGSIVDPEQLAIETERWFGISDDPIEWLYPESPWWDREHHWP